MQLIVIILLVSLLDGVAGDAVASKIYGLDEDDTSELTDDQRASQLKAEQDIGKIEGDMWRTIYSRFPDISGGFTSYMSPIPGDTYISREIKQVPFKFSDEDNKRLDEKAKAAVKAAHKFLEDFTCVEFNEEATKDRKYIRYRNDDNEKCFTGIANNQASMDINIGASCHYRGSVLHQIMHALGFNHVTSRLDHDQYIKVDKDEVKPEARVNKFYHYSYPSVTDMPYDYNSIMHLPDNAYSQNGEKTIKTKKNIGGRLGQRKGLSACDLVEVRKAFKCEENDLAREISDACYTAGNSISNQIKDVDLDNIPNKVKVPKNVAAIVTSSQRIILGPANGKGKGEDEGAVIIPVWPDDFSISGIGDSSSCHCGGCDCQCEKIADTEADENQDERKKHFLCYKKKNNSPGIEFSNKGPKKGKRCTQLLNPRFGNNWRKHVICVPTDSPYHFEWSPKAQMSNPKEYSCLTMDYSRGRNLKNAFLCGKNTQATA